MNAEDVISSIVDNEDGGGRDPAPWVVEAFVVAEQASAPALASRNSDRIK